MNAGMPLRELGDGRIGMLRLHYADLFQIKGEADGMEVQLTVADWAAARSFADKGLKPFTKEEVRRAFAPDPEWEALESAMSQRRIPKPEPD